MSKDIVVKEDQGILSQLLEKAAKERTNLPANVKERVKEISNPEHWVPKMEDTGTAMYEAGQEMLLVIEDCLRRYHKFDDNQLKTLSKQISDVLLGNREFEGEGLSILSIHSQSVVGDLVEKKGIANLLQEIAETRLKKVRYARSGLEFPLMGGSAPFIQRLKEKNKGK